MNERARPVFISYASQDTDSAKRVAESLRAAGVEVWFDQHELHGGDAWDAKIRQQIKECSLFVPLISKETDSRPEGYFRLEWKLAVDRSYLMADDHSFLFPIAIGDVTEATARVPEKFRDLQWTRLRLDQTPAELAARVAGILTTGNSGLEFPARHREPRFERRRKRDFVGRFWWLIFPLFGMAMAINMAVRTAPNSERRGNSHPKNKAFATPPAAPVIAKQQLITDVWPLIESGSHAELRAADQLCKRAVANDAADSEAWAAWAQTETQLIARGFDRTPQRRLSAQEKVSHALQLDPGGYEARLAQACLWAYGEVDATTAPPPQTAGFLRDLMKERPGDNRPVKALAALGKKVFKSETPEGVK